MEGMKPALPRLSAFPRWARRTPGEHAGTRRASGRLGPVRPLSPLWAKASSSVGCKAAKLQSSGCVLQKSFATAGGLCGEGGI